ncbi:hypothetical protein L6452_38506 [Arctium lappa]|uniref:Uncharacterized protein n=1 Tax=Arctium lappa TaxID=4217 RepID=A0ACB8XPR2_ARCLA|nr:hypothetical protein L6452_38506 [Arctium lappa]
MEIEKPQDIVGEWKAEEDEQKAILRKCLIDNVVSLDHLEAIQAVCKSKKLSECKLKYLGGRNVLLAFETEEMKNCVLSNKVHEWSEEEENDDEWMVDESVFLDRNGKNDQREDGQEVGKERKMDEEPSVGIPVPPPAPKKEMVDQQLQGNRLEVNGGFEEAKVNSEKTAEDGHNDGSSGTVVIGLGDIDKAHVENGDGKSGLEFNRTGPDENKRNKGPFWESNGLSVDKANGPTGCWAESQGGSESRKLHGNDTQEDG